MTLLVIACLAIAVFLDSSIANRHSFVEHYDATNIQLRDYVPNDLVPWITGPRSKKYQFNIGKQSWMAAREKCLAQNADLVTIETEEELKWLLSHYKPQFPHLRERQVQIGLLLDSPKPNETESVWRWLNGKPLDQNMMNWAFGEPYDEANGRERCAMLNIKLDANIDDIDCDMSAGPELSYRFVCERTHEKHIEHESLNNPLWKKLEDILNFFGIRGAQQDDTNRTSGLEEEGYWDRVLGKNDAFKKRNSAELQERPEKQINAKASEPAIQQQKANAQQNAKASEAAEQNAKASEAAIQQQNANAQQNAKSFEPEQQSAKASEPAQQNAKASEPAIQQQNAKASEDVQQNAKASEAAEQNAKASEPAIQQQNAKASEAAEQNAKASEPVQQNAKASEPAIQQQNANAQQNAKMENITSKDAPNAKSDTSINKQSMNGSDTNEKNAMETNFVVPSSIESRVIEPVREKHPVDHAKSLMLDNTPNSLIAASTDTVGTSVEGVQRMDDLDGQNGTNKFRAFRKQFNENRLTEKTKNDGKKEVKKEVKEKAEEKEEENSKIEERKKEQKPAEEKREEGKEVKKEGKEEKEPEKKAENKGEIKEEKKTEEKEGKANKEERKPSEKEERQLERKEEKKEEKKNAAMSEEIKEGKKPEVKEEKKKETKEERKKETKEEKKPVEKEQKKEEVKDENKEKMKEMKEEKKPVEKEQKKEEIKEEKKPVEKLHKKEEMEERPEEKEEKKKETKEEKKPLEKEQKKEEIKEEYKPEEKEEKKSEVKKEKVPEPKEEKVPEQKEERTTEIKAEKKNEAKLEENKMGKEEKKPEVKEETKAPTDEKREESIRDGDMNKKANIREQPDMKPNNLITSDNREWKEAKNDQSGGRIDQIMPKKEVNNDSWKKSEVAMKQMPKEMIADQKRPNEENNETKKQTEKGQEKKELIGDQKPILVTTDLRKPAEEIDEPKKQSDKAMEMPINDNKKADEAADIRNTIKGEMTDQKKPNEEVNDQEKPKEDISDQKKTREEEDQSKPKEKENDQKKQNEDAKIPIMANDMTTIEQKKPIENTTDHKMAKEEENDQKKPKGELICELKRQTEEILEQKRPKDNINEVQRQLTADLSDQKKQTDKIKETIDMETNDQIKANEKKVEERKTTGIIADPKMPKEVIKEKNATNGVVIDQRAGKKEINVQKKPEATDQSNGLDKPKEALTDQSNKNNINNEQPKALETDQTKQNKETNDQRTKTIDQTKPKEEINVQKKPEVTDQSNGLDKPKEALTDQSNKKEHDINKEQINAEKMPKYVIADHGKLKALETDQMKKNEEIDGQKTKMIGQTKPKEGINDQEKPKANLTDFMKPKEETNDQKEPKTIGTDQIKPKEDAANTSVKSKAVIIDLGDPKENNVNDRKKITTDDKAPKVMPFAQTEKSLHKINDQIDQRIKPREENRDHIKQSRANTEHPLSGQRIKPTKFRKPFDPLSTVADTLERTMLGDDDRDQRKEKSRFETGVGNVNKNGIIPDQIAHLERIISAVQRVMGLGSVISGGGGGGSGGGGGISKKEEEEAQRNEIAAEDVPNKKHTKPEKPIDQIGEDSEKREESGKEKKERNREQEAGRRKENEKKKTEDDEKRGSNRREENGGKGKEREEMDSAKKGVNGGEEAEKMPNLQQSEPSAGEKNVQQPEQNKNNTDEINALHEMMMALEADFEEAEREAKTHPDINGGDLVHNIIFPEPDGMAFDECQNGTAADQTEKAAENGVDQEDEADEADQLKNKLKQNLELFGGPKERAENGTELMEVPKNLTTTNERVNEEKEVQKLEKLTTDAKNGDDVPNNAENSTQSAKNEAEVPKNGENSTQIAKNEAEVPKNTANLTQNAANGTEVVKILENLTISIDNETSSTKGENRLEKYGRKLGKQATDEHTNNDTSAGIFAESSSKIKIHDGDEIPITEDPPEAVQLPKQHDTFGNDQQLKNAQIRDDDQFPDGRNAKETLDGKPLQSIQSGQQKVAISAHIEPKASSSSNEWILPFNKSENGANAKDAYSLANNNASSSSSSSVFPQINFDLIRNRKVPTQIEQRHGEERARVGNIYEQFRTKESVYDLIRQIQQAEARRLSVKQSLPPQQFDVNGNLVTAERPTAAEETNNEASGFITENPLNLN